MSALGQRRYRGAVEIIILLLPIVCSIQGSDGVADVGGNSSGRADGCGSIFQFELLEKAINVIVVQHWSSITVKTIISKYLPYPFSWLE